VKVAEAKKNKFLLVMGAIGGLGYISTTVATLAAHARHGGGLGSRLGILMAVTVVVLSLATALSARPGQRIVGLALLMGWAVPGLGHLVLGRWKKGLFFFGVLALTYLAGLWIIGFRTVSFDANPFYYVGQYGSGTTMLVGSLLAKTPITSRPLPIDFYDPGLLYVCVSGLLNLVVMFNCFDAVGAPAAGAPAPAAVPAAKEEKPA
jgi:hypothetical protein